MKNCYPKQMDRFMRPLLVTVLAIVLALGWPGWFLTRLTLDCGSSQIVNAADEDTILKGLEIDGSVLINAGDLAFIQNGSLYVLDGTTGKAISLNNSGQGFKPVWSNDGQWLAYILLSDKETERGSLWMVKRDGTQGHRIEGLPGQVFKDNYAWSPVGNKLAITCQGLWLVGEQGPARLQASQASEYGLAWSPDGNRIAYSATLAQDRGEDVEARSDALYTIDISSDKIKKHLVSPEAGIKVASWQPDNQGIFYWSLPLHSPSLAADGARLFSFKIGDSQAKQLLSGLTYREWMSPSPNGQVAYIAGSGRIAWTDKALVISDAPGSNEADISSPGRVTLDPAFSPDGTKIAYVTAEDLGDKVWGFKYIEDLDSWLDSRCLGIAASDGSGAKSITEAGKRVYQPQWSRDGKSIMYISEDSVWIIDVMSKERHKVMGPLSLPPTANDFHFGFYGRALYSDLIAWHTY